MSSSAFLGILIIGDDLTSKEYFHEYLQVGLKNTINQFSKELAEDICK
jgi:hypothetical protein